MNDEGVPMAQWWPLAWSSELRQGEVQPRRLHGRELVLWRGESDQAHVLDAFCLHLGHHLGYNGRVCGDDVRCFFHGWQWSPEGRNTLIPYDERTHKGRRITAWPVRESGGLVLVASPGIRTPATPDLPPVRSCLAPLEVRLKPGLLLENLLDPHTARLLLDDGIGPQPPEVDRAGGHFRACHHDRAGGASPVQITVYGPGLAVVNRGGRTCTLAISPRGESVEVRWGLTGEGVDPDRARESVRAFVELAARMSASPPAGSQAISELRDWLATDRTMSEQGTR